jgi:outer membrane protein assembly factor BamB
MHRNIDRPFLMLTILMRLINLCTLAVLLLFSTCKRRPGPEPDKNALVFIGTSDPYKGTLYAVDANTGQAKWTFETTNYIPSSPTIADRIVYMSSDDGYLYALDVNTGVERWRYNIGGYVVSSPIVVNGVVYIGGGDRGKLYAIDANLGTEKWSIPVTGPDNLSRSLFSSPLLVDNLVYMGSVSGRLSAVNAATGTLAWQFATPDNIPIMAGATTLNGVIYACSLTTVYALDARTGALRWEYDTGYPATNSSPTVYEGVLYVNVQDIELVALDAPSGRLMWKLPIQSGAVSASRRSSPVVSDGILYMANTDLNLYAIDLGRKQIKWKLRTGASIMISSPVVANGVLYLGGDKLYAVNASNGTVQWTYRTNTGIDASACVLTTKGNVYHSGISGATP